MKRSKRLKRKKSRRTNKVAAAAASAAIVAGAVAVTGKAMAHPPDPHELPVALDTDADLLATAEELAIGYRPFHDDQNHNQTPDGAELAKRCAQIIDQLPFQEDAAAGETYKQYAYTFGLETCEICGAQINMGGAVIVNPRLNLTAAFPLIGIHYLEHGSFSYAGSVHEGRIDLPLLLRVLELRFPHVPDEHELAVGGDDLDDDQLTDAEELAAGFNLYHPDQDENLTPDGVDLAGQCAAAIDQLPHYYEGITETYKITFEQRGLETCQTCGRTVNMGYVQITNPQLALTLDVPFVTLHAMQHGSFNYAGNVHGSGRIDVPLLVQILGIPNQCGHLGTAYLPADLNRDCHVNWQDFALFAQQWGQDTDPADQH